MKPWMIIGGITILLGAIGGSAVPPGGRKWFNRLRRPDWLTFEPLIPFIWLFVFVCGAWSATLVWNADPGSQRTWTLMGFYLLVELVTLSYSSVMFLTRSLKVGFIIGATGFVLALILAAMVLPISGAAVGLLLPYFIWSPIGTYVTYKMMRLNPADA